jgi:subtilase family serine protease
MVYPQPDYQAGVVPAALATIPGAAARVVPDVAMLADPMTGFVIGLTGRSGSYGEEVIGGTSLASPLFTATIALAQQNAGRSFGFANPLLYQASQQGALRDIQPGASPEAVAVPGGVVTTFEYPNLAIHTAVGYDNETGLGVPDGESFLSAMQ